MSRHHLPDAKIFCMNAARVCFGSWLTKQYMAIIYIFLHSILRSVNSKTNLRSWQIVCFCYCRATNITNFCRWNWTTDNSLKVDLWRAEYGMEGEFVNVTCLSLKYTKWENVSKMCLLFYWRKFMRNLYAYFHLFLFTRGDGSSSRVGFVPKASTSSLSPGRHSSGN